MCRYFSIIILLNNYLTNGSEFFSALNLRMQTSDFPPIQTLHVDSMVLNLLHHLWMKLGRGSEELAKEGSQEMGDENRESAGGTHILVFPLPAQGHISPMVQFSKRLASKGLRVTVISASSRPLRARAAPAIHFEQIFDGFQGNEEKPSIEAYFERFRAHASKSLFEFIEEQKRSAHPPKVLVYDSILPWALDVAQDLGLVGASFFTQPWAVGAIYYHVHRGGSCRMPKEEQERPVLHSFPSLPMLRTKDLPSFLGDSSSYPSLFGYVVSRFSNFERANWLLCNTFDKLEEKVVKWMESARWPVKSIGPMIPSMFLDKRLKNDKDYSLSLFEPDINACKEWLDSKQPNSVVYVSFGSVAALGEDQMEELAAGLRLSGSFFLWVVRASEMDKLPRNYAEDVSGKGLIVNWSPQLEVLAHEATGCFVTHCGWNSALEALSLGVPMVAVPQWTDQLTNAKFVSDVWKVGIRVEADRNGLVKRGEIVRCVKEVMEGEKGEEIRSNSAKWKELAKEALSGGGSSDRNINELVAEFASY